MNQLTMKSTDFTQVNIDKIAALFPNVITEARDEQGKIKRAIDFDLLRQELSDYLVEGEKERYQLTWPGKKEAILQANATIDKTLRPVKDDSLNWGYTQNLYIEGDNFEVLKLLQESYLNKIKLIYIDPPYNTGKDFIYKDDFKLSLDEYTEESGQVDDQGNRLYQNTEANGRFHSDWLTMMYSRLRIAKNLLREDGLIFISIDDNEVDNLRKICDDCFSRTNFIGTFSWRRSISSNDAQKHFSNDHEYILVYGKSSSSQLLGLSKSDAEYTNTDNDPRGPWKKSVLVCSKTKDERPNLYYPITDPATGITYDCNPNLVWAYEKKTMKRLIEEGRIIFPKNGQGKPALKLFWNDLRSHRKPVSSFIDKQEGFEFQLNSAGTKEINNIFEGKVFTYPKPSENIKQLINVATENDDIILDFFSGSASTAHAVMQLNADDGGKRRFVMVQVPEPTEESSEAYKAGFTTICEIGKERIRRAAKKIKEETGADIDYGFRVYRVDSSNMKDVYYTPDRLGQMNLDDMSSNIKEDRTGEDLLIQVMLECGLELSLPMESKEIEGKTVYYVAGNSLIACFDDEVSESVIKKIAEDQPLRVVFRDSSFRDDSARINVEELFKLLSPSTEIQVL